MRGGVGEFGGGRRGAGELVASVQGPKSQRFIPVVATCPPSPLIQPHTPEDESRAPMELRAEEDGLGFQRECSASLLTILVIRKSYGTWSRRNSGSRSRSC